MNKVGGEAFANYILDMLEISFPKRNFNRAIKLPTKYFSERFNMLPNDIKKLLIHIVIVADAAAERVENKITQEQENVQGFPYTVSEKKQMNQERIARALVRDSDMKLLNSQIKKIPIPMYYGYGNIDDFTANEHLKKGCYEVNIPIKTALYYQFIMKFGTKEEQEILARRGSLRTIEKIYKMVFKSYLGQQDGTTGN